MSKTSQDKALPPYASHDHIAIFIERVRNIPKHEVDRLRGLALSEIRLLKHKKWIDQRGNPRTGYSLSSLRTYIRDYRNAIRLKLGQNHPILRFFKLSEDDQASVAHTTKEAVVHNQRFARPVDTHQLAHVALETLKNAQTEPTLKIAAALILATGRRPIELFVTGSFKTLRKNDKRPEYLKKQCEVLQFAGQAKTRDAEGTRHGAYMIPALFDSRLILNAFAEMQSRHDYSGLYNLRS